MRVAQLLQHAAHEDRHVDVRRLQRAVRRGHPSRLDRREAGSRRSRVGRHAAESLEARLQRQVAAVLRVIVAAVRVRLPDLDQRIVDRPAVGVDDAAFDRRRGSPVTPGADELSVDEPGEADVQIRADGLREVVRRLIA